MENVEFLKKIKKKGIDPENLTSEDIKTLIEMNIKGQFGKEVFKEFLKEANVTYTTFVEGLKNFVNVHKDSSNKYIEALNSRMKDLMEQAKNAKTADEKDRLDKKIDEILDRLKQEADANRSQGQKYALIAGGVATIVAGGAIFLVTRNPEVIKKGAEMIAKETLKQIV
ncbi:hypothetical protein DZB84_18485 [Bacillus sp. HNG]|uniref:hypothetical protein n=1 Tax=Bacillus sp. HNG TaxID=2293325 RepID=UPI000E2F4E2B|nr:hypothetical protein [Bacillus sp. HNG]RFB12737.1 hypothetical protein DZB84_18485 [Bacillus sp. HNG]